MKTYTPAEIAVAMPAYRATAALPRAVESVLRQTFRDLEVWIVDDGSPDETGAVADALVRQDARVRVIHQRNDGCYQARLRAFRRTRSPWIGTVDADDEAAPTLYERLHAFATEHNLDVAQCDTVGTPAREPELFLNREATFRGVIEPKLFRGEGAFVVWDKLYRNRFDFDTYARVPILMFEDIALNLQLFEHVERVGLLHEGLYLYDINAGSSVRNYREKSFLDFMRTDALRREMAPRYGLSPDDVVFDAWVIKNARNHLVLASLAPAPSWGERLENVLRIIRNDRIRAAAKRVRPAPELRLAFHFPRLTILLFRLAKHLRH